MFNKIFVVVIDSSTIDLNGTWCTRQTLQTDPIVVDWSIIYSLELVDRQIVDAIDVRWILRFDRRSALKLSNAVSHRESSIGKRTKTFSGTSGERNHRLVSEDCSDKSKHFRCAYRSSGWLSTRVSHRGSDESEHDESCRSFLRCSYRLWHWLCNKRVDRRSTTPDDRSRKEENTAYGFRCTANARHGCGVVGIDLRGHRPR